MKAGRAEGTQKQGMSQCLPFGIENPPPNPFGNHTPSSLRATPSEGEKRDTHARQGSPETASPEVGEVSRSDGEV